MYLISKDKGEDIMLKNKVCIKIFVLLFMCMFLVAGFAMSSNTKAYAMELNYDEYDEVFLQSSKELIEKQYDDGYSIVADKELVYDMQQNKFGYVYDFSINGEKGYAIVVNIDNIVELEEIFFNSSNPYETSSDETKIYVSNLIYLTKDEDGNYKESGELLSEVEVQYYNEIAYASSAGSIVEEQETIYYASKNTIANFSLANKIPSCCAETNLGSNICVPVAGANIIQYYDRYNNNLIPNYTPGRGAGNIYVYNTISDTLRNVITQLYSDMGTNSTVAGTTINQFKSGLNTYCSRQGYSVSYVSCMNGGAMDYALVKSNIGNQKPVIIFVSKSIYTVDISNNSGYDVVKNSTYTANHSLVAFGYKEIKYTFSDGSSRTINMLQVATGVAGLDNGYLNLNKNNIINDVMAVIIN